MESSGASFTQRVFVLGTAAGGVMMGGFTVAVLTSAGWLPSRFVFLNAAGFFILGCGVAAVPAALLGFLGGDRQERRGRALARGLLWLVPVLVLAALLSGWIAIMPLALHLKRPGLLAGTTAAWLLGLLLVRIGAGEAAAGVRCVSRRWRGPA